MSHAHGPEICLYFGPFGPFVSTHYQYLSSNTECVTINCLLNVCGKKENQEQKHEGKLREKVQGMLER